MTSTGYLLLFATFLFLFFFLKDKSKIPISSNVNQEIHFHGIFRAFSQFAPISKTSLLSTIWPRFYLVDLSKSHAFFRRVFLRREVSPPICSFRENFAKLRPAFAQILRFAPFLVQYVAVISTRRFDEFFLVFFTPREFLSSRGRGKINWGCFLRGHLSTRVLFCDAHREGFFPPAGWKLTEMGILLESGPSLWKSTVYQFFYVKLWPKKCWKIELETVSLQSWVLLKILSR